MAINESILEVTLQIPAGVIEGIAAKVPEANSSGLLRVARAAQNIAERKVNAIRRRKVPTRRQVATYRQAHRVRKTNRALRPITASDEPAWRPTGKLAESVEAEPVFTSPEEIALTAAVPYAEPRHELGVTWTPVDPALGVIRKDPFFQEAADIVAPQIPDLYADGWNQVMNS